ncbi:MAG: endonuclease/exonuclease/phosphatase family protein [Burkholderiaceae bacterium]|nr:endonuclease/exonuclease/phosphatase family protein [Burkholderiaceae bacterium]
MSTHCIAFWNVENLLDVEDAPLDRRSDKLRRALKVGTGSSEVKGWNQAALDRKISRLALVVTQDQRGIDVAFLYDPAVFQVEAGGVFSHYIVKRTATRDLLQVNFLDTRGRRLVCIGNHWPSRLGGRFESEPFRIIAAETLAYFHERIAEIHGQDVAVLAMGDFNDEPWDRSLAEHARSHRTRAKVTRATSAALLNLMWPTGGALKGTHFHDNQPGVLDQFLVSKGLLTGKSGFTVQTEATAVLDLPVMVTGGVYPQPRPLPDRDDGAQELRSAPARLNPAMPPTVGPVLGPLHLSEPMR